MREDQLVTYLDHPEQGADWLRTLGLENIERAHANLLSVARSGLPLDLMRVIAEQLEEGLPRISDPDMALNSFDRFMAAARNPLALAALMERDTAALPILLQIFSASQ